MSPAKSFHPTVREYITSVVSNEVVNQQYKQLCVSVSPLALQARPGQFFHLLCPQSDDLSPFFRRPMSIYRIDSRRGHLHFLYKITGIGTESMSKLQPGDPFNIFGPLGQGFSLHPSWRNLLVVARGVGLATLAPLAQTAQQEERQLYAICSARSADYLLSVDYFRELGATVFTVTDSDGSSDLSNVENLITNLIQHHGIDALFTCGSNRLLKLLQDLARSHNLPGQVALEQQMACGLGMCFCCVRTFMQNDQPVDLRVCKDGPVFDLEEAVTW